MSLVLGAYAFVIIGLMAWSMRVGGAMGEVVEGDDEIAQAVMTALSTQKGSVPREPLYGLDRLELVDEPMTTLAPKATRLVRQCFAISLPRALFLSVEVLDPTEGGRATIRVNWQPTAGGAPRASEVQV